MKIRSRPVEKPKPLDVQPVDNSQAAPVVHDVHDAPLPPVPKAEPGATVLGSSGPQGALVERPQAAWSAQAKAIAAEVLAGVPAGTMAMRVQHAMAVLLARTELAGAHVSCVVLGEKGEPIVDHQGAEPTNPCSNAKVVTASWALSVLGPAHRFKTAIAVAADGTLVVRGGFDPTLTRATIDDIVAALKKKGVTAAPRLVLDVSAMRGGNIPASFARYGEEDWEYLARPEPLSVNKNLLQLTVTPGDAPGAPAHVAVDSGAYAVRSRVQTVDVATPFKVGCDEVDGLPGSGGVLERDASGRVLIDVWGTIAADYAKGKTLTMKSPAPLEQVAWAWTDAFERAGIACGTVDVGGPVPGAQMLHEHASKPLATVLQTSLSTSNAFDHEMFTLAAAHKLAGGPVTLPEAAAGLTAFLHALGATGSVDGGADGGVLVNGSGIGNESRVPAQAIARLLARTRTDPRLASIGDALARPGQGGTLKGRMLDTAAETRFRGKTGTGERAVALSGLCGDLVLSLLVDEMRTRRDDVRAVLDATAIVLSSLGVPESGA